MTTGIVDGLTDRTLEAYRRLLPRAGHAYWRAADPRRAKDIDSGAMGASERCEDQTCVHMGRGRGGEWLAQGWYASSYIRVHTPSLTLSYRSLRSVGHPIR